jgi:hypothetical protein
MRVMTEDVSAQLITDEIALGAAREAFLLVARAPHSPSWSGTAASLVIGSL